MTELHDIVEDDLDLDELKEFSTAVITDIRNFSKTFKDFQGKNSPNFLRFIKRYYLCQNKLARTLSDKVHMSSTGDGILAIFLDEENNHKVGFAYVLGTHRLLNNMCNKFMEENPGSLISFGMGADSGNVWNVGEGYLNTYVGTVINRASRLEQTTKLFARATTAIGNGLYMKLLKEFYPSTHQLIKENNDYDELLNDNAETILISKQFMLQYVYDIELKGIQTNAPLFRMSESLVKKDKLYWEVMDKLIGPEKAQEIREIIQ
jgi:class 3 adenylate cyclase